MPSINQESGKLPIPIIKNDQTLFSEITVTAPSITACSKNNDLVATASRMHYQWQGQRRSEHRETDIEIKYLDS